MKLYVFGIAGLMLVVTAGQVQAGIIISSWNLGLNAHDAGDSVSFGDNTVSLPFSSTQTATTSGGITGTTAYDFNVSGNNGSFEVDFNGLRTGAVGTSVNTYGDIFFTVSEASTFTADAFHSMDGSGRLHMKFRVRDMTISGGTAGFVYDSFQLSGEAQNESFELGGLDGDTKNSQFGTLPGLLIAGHEYLMQYNFDIGSPGSVDSGATSNHPRLPCLASVLSDSASAEPDDAKWHSWRLPRPSQHRPQL